MYRPLRTLSATLVWTSALVAVAELSAAAPADEPSEAATTPPQVALSYRDDWPADNIQQSTNVGQPVWKTSFREVRDKVLRPVWETQYREEQFTVRRPVIETSMRAQPCTAPQAVTTFEPVQLNQGQWVEQLIREPNRPVNRLKWVPAGWNVDPKTGLQYWRPGMLRPVRVELPGRVRTYRVWQPNIVTTPVPTTSYTPRVQTRNVPVQTVRYVTERRVRKVPVQVCRMVEQEIVRQVPVTTCGMSDDDLKPVLAHSALPRGEAN